MLVAGAGRAATACVESGRDDGGTPPATIDCPFDVTADPKRAEVSGAEAVAACRRIC
jgi:hypothetical protein